MPIRQVPTLKPRIFISLVSEPKFVQVREYLSYSLYKHLNATFISLPFFLYGDFNLVYHSFLSWALVLLLNSTLSGTSSALSISFLSKFHERYLFLLPCTSPYVKTRITSQFLNSFRNTIDQTSFKWDRILWSKTCAKPLRTFYVVLSHLLPKHTSFSLRCMVLLSILAHHRNREKPFPWNSEKEISVFR